MLLVIIITCFFSYFQTTGFEFIRWDDDTQITENQYVKTLNLENVNHNLQKERFTFLTLTTYSVIYNIWGDDPQPFHWLSIFMHLLNVMLVFRLIKNFSENSYTIYFVTILFALHPMRVESVAWISELKDLLFTTFSLISFLFYFKYAKKDYKTIYFVIAALMAVLASFSKIQGLLVPLSFFLIDIYLKRKISIVSVLEKILLVLFILFILKIVAVAIILIAILYKYNLSRRKWLFKINKPLKTGLFVFSGIVLAALFFYFFYAGKQGMWSKVTDLRNTFTFPERFLLAGFALWFYLKSFFLPFSQNAVHPYPQRSIDGSLPFEYYLTLVILLIVIIFSLYLIIKRKKISGILFFGWFFFLLNISMVLHFIPIEGRLVVADRYSYLAYLGLIISVAWVGEFYIFQKQKYKTLSLIVALLIMPLLSISTYNRGKVWKNTKVLFTDVLDKNPDISFAYLNLAGTYLNSQKPDSALICFDKSILIDSLDPTSFFNRASAYIKLLDEKSALKDYGTVLRISKNKRYLSLANASIGEIYRKSGQDSLALHFYNKAIELDSLLSVAYNYRGVFYLNKNRLKDAKNDFTKAINLNPDYSDALNNYGWAISLEGELDRAMSFFDRSLEIDPYNSFAFDNRGYLKYLKNDKEGALLDFNKAIQINPALSQAYINRGRTWASMKNFSNAISDFTVVIKSDPHNMAAITNRAYAYLYNNDVKNAEADFRLNVSIYPERALALQNLAWFHMQIKDYPSALKEFEKTLLMDTKLITSYINLGWIYSEMKEYTKAEQNLKSALVLNPRNPEALFWLGELNRKKGDNVTSCEYYSKASELGYLQAKNALNQYCYKPK